MGTVPIHAYNLPVKELSLRLMDSERKLNALDAEISSVQASLDKLVLERDEERLRFSKLSNATSYHSKLPPELLAEIFQHFVSKPVIIRSNQGPSTVTPLVLTHVCAAWRALALNTPTLWNRVLLECTDWKDLDKLACRVHNVLQNSGSYPIYLYTAGPDTHIYLQSPPSAPRSFEQGSDFIQELIEPYASRLKELVLSFPSSWLQYFLSVSVGSDWNFPQLRAVELVYHSVEYGDAHKDSIDFFINAPLLTHFKLVAAHHTTFLRSTFAYVLPWSQLTDVHLVRFNVPPRSLPHLLSSCTSILSCTLTIMKETLAPETLVIIPTLHTLTLYNPHNFDYNKYLESLAFPALTRLSIVLDGGRTSKKWSHHQFITLLARSSCTLKSLRTTAHIEHPDIEAVLGEVPSITKLDVQLGQPLSASTLRLICHGLLAPNLEAIKCVVEPTMLGDFLDMLDCRYVPPRSPAVYRGIRKAVARCEGYSENEDLVVRLEEFKVCGRDVTVKKWKE